MSWLRDIRYIDKVMIKRADGSIMVATVNEEPSKTQQQFKDECDVNNIVKKYETTGEWLHLTKRQGVYADVSEIKDYHQSLDKVQRANDAFMSLPAEMRLRFKNDPGQLLEFLADPKNKEEGIKLGLYEKPAPSELPNDAQTTKGEPQGEKIVSP